MKPAPFDYVAATTVAEAVTLLSERPGAKLIAGGQSLMQQLNFRELAPPSLIDVNGLTELDYVRLDGDYLAVGALTRHRTLERDPIALEHLPILAEVIPYIAYVPVRHRGTIGGSFAHAAPYAELPLMSLVLDGQVVVEGVGGARTIAADTFFVGHLQSALTADEIVTEVRFKLPAPGTGLGFEEVARRRHDYAIASAAAAISLDASGAVAAARVAVGGAHPTPLRVQAAEQALAGSPPSEAAVTAAADAAAAAITPIVDGEVEGPYRRRLVGALTRRALQQAIERSEGA